MSEKCFPIDKNTTIVEHFSEETGELTARAYVGSRKLVVLTPDKVCLYTRGQRDRKTLTSIKNVARYYNLWFFLFTRKGEWYVDTPNHDILLLDETVTFERECTLPGTDPVCGEIPASSEAFIFDRDTQVIISDDGENFEARWLHVTLVRANPEKITLNYVIPMSNATRRRLNRIARVLGLQYRVLSKNGGWYIDASDGRLIELMPGVELPRGEKKHVDQIIRDLSKINA